jgi:hypothetical protein
MEDKHPAKQLRTINNKYCHKYPRVPQLTEPKNKLKERKYKSKDHRISLRGYRKTL